MYISNVAGRKSSVSDDIVVKCYSSRGTWDHVHWLPFLAWPSQSFSLYNCLLFTPHTRSQTSSSTSLGSIIRLFHDEQVRSKPTVSYRDNWNGRNTRSDNCQYVSTELRHIADWSPKNYTSNSTDFPEPRFVETYRSQSHLRIIQIRYDGDANFKPLFRWAWMRVDGPFLQLGLVLQSEVSSAAKQIKERGAAVYLP